jgi:hypothetical protein
VPEPDISLHFLIQLLKRLNQVPNNLIQDLTGAPLIGVAADKIPQGNNRVSGVCESSIEILSAPAMPAICAHSAFG